jgi:hypothetical protein
VAKRGYLSIKLPKLNIATIDQLLGRYDGLGVICADQRDGVIEVTVTANEPSVGLQRN